MKIKEVAKKKKKNIDELNDCREKLKKNIKTEVLMPSGIMQGSILTVVVKSAKNLKGTSANGLASPYVTIDFSGKKVETAVISDTLEPSWNEEFTFPVESRRQEINLVVLSKTVFGDKFLGKLSIPLSSLTDQLKHDQHFVLSPNEPGEKWQGKIFLEIQWIWSKTKYLQDIIKVWEDIIKENEERLCGLKDKLEELQKPFGILTRVDTENSIRPPIGFFESSIRGLESSVKNFENSIRGFENRIPNRFKTEKSVYYSILVYMLLSVLSCYAKTDFVNVRSYIECC